MDYFFQWALDSSWVDRRVVERIYKSGYFEEYTHTIYSQCCATSTATTATTPNSHYAEFMAIFYVKAYKWLVMQLHIW